MYTARIDERIGIGGFRAPLWIAALALLVSRRPDAIAKAQFWAEDGSVFFADAWNRGALQSLALSYAGSFHALQRGVAALALLVPLRFAPLLCNAIALGIQLGTASFLASGRLAQAVPQPRVRLGLAFLYLALPNTSEIHGNLTNSQWHLMLLACLVLLAGPARSRRARGADLGIVGLAAFTGPFCVPLLAVAALRFGMTRAARLRAPLLLLGAGAAAQVALLLGRGIDRGEMPLAATPRLLAEIVGGHVFVAGLVGRQGLAWLEAHAGGVALLLWIAFALGGALFAFALLRGPVELRLLAFFAALVGAMALAVPTASWPLLRPANAANRYWFAALLAFQASLVFALGPRHPRALRLAAASALLLLPIGIALDWQHPRYRDLRFRWHARRLERAPAGAEVAIPLNPGGAWVMRLHKR